MASSILPTPLSGAGGGMGGPPANERINMDSPPFSRVFIVCSRHHREEDLRAAFEGFGEVEDVWMVKVEGSVCV